MQCNKFITASYLKKNCTQLTIVWNKDINSSIVKMNDACYKPPKPSTSKAHQIAYEEQQIAQENHPQFTTKRIHGNETASRPSRE